MRVSVKSVKQMAAAVHTFEFQDKVVKLDVVELLGYTDPAISTDVTKFFADYALLVSLHSVLEAMVTDAAATFRREDSNQNEQEFREVHTAFKTVDTCLDAASVKYNSLCQAVYGEGHQMMYPLSQAGH